jgi:hypothetical protein
MKNPIPTATPGRNPSGGNVHRTVWARELSSGTPRLRIAAILFLQQTS